MYKIELLQPVNSIGLYTIIISLYIITEDACSVLDLTIFSPYAVFKSVVRCTREHIQCSIHLLKQKTEDTCTCIKKQICSNLQVRYIN